MEIKIKRLERKLAKARAKLAVVQKIAKSMAYDKHCLEMRLETLKDNLHRELGLHIATQSKLIKALDTIELKSKQK